MPVAALAAGLLAARRFEFSPFELLPAILALFCLALAGLWRTRTTRPLFPALACLTALALAGSLLGVAHRPPPAPELNVASRELAIFTGCVATPPAFSEDREQFLLELEPGARARVTFYLREGEQPPELRYGQRIEFEGRARRIRNFQNPGSFDYVQHLARQNVYWTVSARPGTLRVLSGDCGSRFRRTIFALRVEALERLENLFRQNAFQTAMMQAVLIGESSRLEKIWTEAYRRTGTYHALVISGLHVSVLAAVFLFLLRLCLVPQGLALAGTTVAAWLYALVAGGQPPVVRAAAGFTLFTVGRYFYRQVRLLNLLAAAAIGFLVVDPEQLFDASFQLSFLSVAAIGALAVPVLEATSAPLARGLRSLSDRALDLMLPPRAAHFRLEVRLLAETVSLWTRVPERWVLRVMAPPLRLALFLFELVVISGAVQTGLALPLAVYFHRLSAVGLSANLAVVPLMSLVVPVGFLALLTGWGAPASVAGWLLEMTHRITVWHAAREPAWRIPDPPLWLGPAFTAALLGVALGWRRSRRLLALAVGAVAVLLAVLILYPFPADVRPGVLELTAIDVGQAESLFLAFPDGKLAVIDGGGFPSGGRRRAPRLDIGEDVVSTYLWSRSIRRLDAVAATHAHEDHISGLAALIDNFRPKELWVGAMPEAPAWTELRRKAQPAVRIVSLRAGQRLAWGGARLEVLAPAADYAPGAAPHNNDSLVLRLEYGRHAILLTGDIERRIEAELLERGLVGKADVIKVAHHGSRTSTGAPFLDLVRPAFAVISAGFENPYGLPHPELLKRLQDRRVMTLRTDRNGLVTIRTDGRRFDVEARRWQ